MPFSNTAPIQLIGVNALWLAAKYGEVEILRTLAGHGADPFVSPENGMSALQAAMGVRGDTENRRNQRGLPSLSLDDEEQLTLELAQITLDLGVNVNAADQQGNTALHYAVRRDFESVVDFLAPSRIIQVGGVERRVEFPTVVELLDRTGTIHWAVEDFHVC